MGPTQGGGLGGPPVGGYPGPPPHAYPPTAPPPDGPIPTHSTADPTDTATSNDIVTAFKQALEEAGTTPFSLYERQAKKCKGDPRFEAVTSQKDRKALFEELCRELAQRKKQGEAPKGGDTGKVCGGGGGGGVYCSA